MKIAVLSGKGGAGKTMTAVNLAAAAKQAVYLDCDVEEPNGRLFFHPEQVESRPVHTLLPTFDAAKCTGCRKCVTFCRFHALIYIREKPQVFAEVCHSCGGCALVCPESAITEKPKGIGIVETGFHRNVQIVTGVLNPGEASGVPVIRQVLRESGDGLTIIDCPPGSACSVMESVADADLCLLVAEPTAFGFHNFKMVYELVTLLGRPCAVVVNKAEEQPYQPLEDFCNEKGIPILLRIPYRPDFATLGAAGKILVEENEEACGMFRELLQKIGGSGQ